MDKYAADDMKEFLQVVAKIEGIFRRWIAELWQLQAVIYVSENCVLDPSLSREIVDYKVAKHQQRRKLATTSKRSK